MRAVSLWLRRGLFAAVLSLTALASGAIADVTAQYDAEQGVIVLKGLEDATRERLLSDPALAKLQVVGLGALQGTPVTINEVAGGLHISPRFSLRAGTDYVLHIDLESASQVFNISIPAPNVPAPRLAAFTPSQSVIPANTLRLYLSFSESMARGNLRDAITLSKSDGTKVDSPFLALGPELWDKAQKRVTLLFDPGRIKQGVGPNLSHGAPLEAGESYHLVIDGSLESAEGVPLGDDVRMTFRVGPAETRAINPLTWHVLSPKAGSQVPLSIAFDRIMDVGPLHRMITLQDSSGQPVPGTVQTDGGGWSFVPDQPWAAGDHKIKIAPELEDVSGNAVHQAFDAPQGTIGVSQEAVTLPVQIGE